MKWFDNCSALQGSWGEDDSPAENPYVLEMDLMASGLVHDPEHDKDGHLTTVDEYDVDEEMIV